MLSLSEYRGRVNRLADLLPWAFLVAPGIILNKDGSFQRTARFRGPDLDSETKSELVAVCARVNNVLRRFGSGWALFFEAERFQVRSYPDSSFPDPLTAAIDHERRQDFEGAGRHHESAFHLTLLYLPPAEAWAKAEDALLERTGDLGDQDSWLRHLDAFRDRTDHAFTLLADVMPEFVPLDDAATLAHLHSTVSTCRGTVTVPEIPAFIDALIADSELDGGIEPRLGGQHLHTLTVLGFPNLTRPGLLDDLNDLAFPYRWTTRFLALGKEEANRALARNRRQWFSKRKSLFSIVKEVMFNQEAALLDSDAGNKANDADAALQELGEDLVSFGYVTITVSVMHSTRGGAKERLTELERVLHGHGFLTIHERMNAVEAWLSSLPGHVYANVRQPIIHTINLAHMMPISAVWAGPTSNSHLEGPPLLMARTRGTTPFRLVPHVDDVGHTLVVGPTGAGKSVLLAMMAMQFRRYPQAQVYVFDKGASCRAAVLGMGGTFLDLSGDGGGGNAGGFAFQPLVAIDAENDREEMFDWVLGLFERSGVHAEPGVRNAVWSALCSLAGAPPPERTLTGLSLLLEDPALREALHPWTVAGPHGRLLDADQDSLELAPVQGFEMEGLIGRPELAAPVLVYLFHRLARQFDGSPTMLVLDEAWVFLDDPLFSAKVREWLKTLRKRNVSVVFATQSIADISNSSVAPAIVESCPSRIFLPNERAGEPGAKEAYVRFGLNERQIEIISRAMPKRDYYYQSRRGSRLFELGLGPLAFTFAGASSRADQARIDAVLHEVGTEGFREAFAGSLVQDLRGVRP